MKIKIHAARPTAKSTNVNHGIKLISEQVSNRRGEVIFEHFFLHHTFRKDQDSQPLLPGLIFAIPKH
jgi:hypothetical protein